MRLSTEGRLSDWKHAISPARDRAQSRILVAVAGSLLTAAAVEQTVTALRDAITLRPLLLSIAASFIFGAVVWLLRAATTGGVALGMLICFLLTNGPSHSHHGFSQHSSLPALVGVFVLSFAATRFGRRRKETRGLAESRRGRRASQIVANLGVAALFAAVGNYIGAIAALAEAAADTVSSEIGQAVGGPSSLVTTWKQVPSGTDGGVTIAGTLAGIAGALIIVVIGGVHHALMPHGGVTFLAACAGLFFDSLLGATIERKGWIGNDLVNFLSTLFAAALASLLV